MMCMCREPGGAVCIFEMVFENKCQFFSVYYSDGNVIHLFMMKKE
jgi:hypothetical protein